MSIVSVGFPVIQDDLDDLSVTFYQKDRFAICEMNGVKFAFINQNIKTEEALNIDLKGHHVIQLSSVEADKDLNIEADSVILLGQVKSKTGAVKIKSDRIAMLGAAVFGTGNRFYGEYGVSLFPIKKSIGIFVKNQLSQGLENKSARSIVGALGELFFSIQDQQQKLKTLEEKAAKIVL